MKNLAIFPITLLIFALFQGYIKEFTNCWMLFSATFIVIILIIGFDKVIEAINNSSKK